MIIDLVVVRLQVCKIILIIFKTFTIKKFCFVPLIVLIHMKTIISFMKGYSLSKANLTQLIKDNYCSSPEYLNFFFSFFFLFLTFPVWMSVQNELKTFLYEI